MRRSDRLFALSLLAASACADLQIPTDGATSDAARDVGRGQDAPVSPPDSSEIDAVADAIVPDDAGATLDAPSAEDVASPMDVAVRDVVDVLDASATDSGRPTLVAVPPPAAPMFPSTIRTLTVTLETSSITNAGTDDGLEVCLNATSCFPLNNQELDDNETGETHVFHIPANVPRAAVTRVRLRTTSSAANNDRYSPACMDLRFDGEPVYCNRFSGVHIGTGSSAGEVREYTDPRGLHQACTSCWGDSMLPVGPMLGAPTANGARVWVRTDATRLVGLRVGTTPTLAGAPVVAWSYPTPDRDFASTLTASGLDPSQDYYYRVEVAGSTSEPIRRLRASLPPGASRFRFGFGSCEDLRTQSLNRSTTMLDPLTNNWRASFTELAPDDITARRAALTAVFTLVREAAPELFFFGGDNHYADSDSIGAQRFHYRTMGRFAAREAVTSTTPTIAIWDDHDFVENNSNGRCVGGDRARSVFSEYTANPSYGESGRGIYFRHREGPVEFFALDCRTFRPEVTGGGADCRPQLANPPLADGPLGAAQTAWLTSALRSSNAPFKMIACGSQFIATGSSDSWASFPAARSALLAMLDRENIDGVVFMSGDIHRTTFVSNPRPGNYTIPEITSSGLNRASTNGCSGMLDTANCTSRDNFVIVDATPDQLTVTAHAVGQPLSRPVLRQVIARSSLIDTTR